MVSCDKKKDFASFRLPVTSAPDKKAIEGGLATRRVDKDGCRNLGKGQIPYEPAKVTRATFRDAYSNLNSQTSVQVSST